MIAGGPGGAPVFEPLPRKIAEVIGEPTVFDPVEQPPTPLKIAACSSARPVNGIVRLDVPRWEAERQGTPRPFATLIRRAFTTGGKARTTSRPS